MKKNMILVLVLVVLVGGGYTLYMNYINGFSMPSQNKSANKQVEMTEEEMKEAHKHGTHVHEPVPTDDFIAIPAIDLEAKYDGLGGVNLKIITQNFTFTPEQVNTVDMPGEGHAHLYINDEKITRVYSPDHYISNKLLPVGTNTIRVELNANSHGNYTYQGNNIEDTIQVEVAPRADGEGGAPW